MKQSCDYLVRVSCMTYNQANYIVDAMNGFTMQETTFPFVCCIVDDASTDGEQKVICQYLQENFDLEDKSNVRQEETDDYVLTFAHHKKNSNCFFAVFFLKYNHYRIKKSKTPYLAKWQSTKYIAPCDGDDYWICSHKLQEQVDILESNPNVTLVHTSYNTVDKDKKAIVRPHYEQLKKRSCNSDGLLELFRGNYIMTVTVCARKEIIESDLFRDSPSKIDYSLFLAAAMLGDICYLNRETACYRNLLTSMMNSKIKQVDCELSKTYKYYIRCFLLKKSHVANDRLTKRIIAERLIRKKEYRFIASILFLDREQSSTFFLTFMHKIYRRIIGLL